MQRSRPAKSSLLLADVDGTLVTKDKVLTERARHAVRAMHDAGIHFALTSGRPPKGMAMLFEPLAIATPVAGFNGGLFTTIDMTIIESRTLDAGAAHAAAGIIEKEGLDVWIYAGDDWLIRKPDAPHREREEHTVQFPPKVVESWGERHLGQGGEDHRRGRRPGPGRACGEKGAGRTGSRRVRRAVQPYYLDVTNPAANKGAVVAYLAQAL